MSVGLENVDGIAVYQMKFCIKEDSVYLMMASRWHRNVVQTSFPLLNVIPYILDIC